MNGQPGNKITVALPPAIAEKVLQIAKRCGELAMAAGAETAGPTVGEVAESVIWREDVQQAMLAALPDTRTEARAQLTANLEKTKAKAERLLAGHEPTLDKLDDAEAAVDAKEAERERLRQEGLARMARQKEAEARADAARQQAIDDGHVPDPNAEEG